MNNSNTSEKTKDMVLIGFMAAIICVMGPFSISLPFTAVPISLTNLAVYFVIYSRNKKGRYQLRNLSSIRSMRTSRIFSFFIRYTETCRTYRRLSDRLYPHGDCQWFFY